MVGKKDRLIKGRRQILRELCESS